MTRIEPTNWFTSLISDPQASLVLVDESITDRSNETLYALCEYDKRPKPGKVLLARLLSHFLQRSCSSPAAEIPSKAQAGYPRLCDYRRILKRRECAFSCCVQARTCSGQRRWTELHSPPDGSRCCSATGIKIRSSACPSYIPCHVTVHHFNWLPGSVRFSRLTRPRRTVPVF